MHVGVSRATRTTFLTRERPSLGQRATLLMGWAMGNYNDLVKLALFCANQARTSRFKEAAREAWRLATQYQEQAAKFGETPDIGDKPRHVTNE